VGSNNNAVDSAPAGFPCLLEIRHKPKGPRGVCKLWHTRDRPGAREGVEAAGAVPGVEASGHFFQHGLNGIVPGESVRLAAARARMLPLPARSPDDSCSWF